jgi:nucleotide-binding universal stress UspA family protein
MFQRILLPLDGSDAAARALAPGWKLARSAQSHVILLRVVPPAGRSPAAHTMTGYGVLRRDLASDHGRSEALTYLQSVQQAAPAGVAVSPRVAEGPVADTIVEIAAAEKADLIVMSSHGYTGLARWLLGSVTERVLQAAPCPVLVVRSPAPMERILIPLDGSPLSERAIAPGTVLAQALGAEVDLLRVVEDTDSAAGMANGFGQADPAGTRQLQERLSADAAAYLDQISHGLQPSSRALRTVLATGRPADCIVDHARQRGVDLIVMSTHGRAGFQRWLYGSVTEKVLRGAHCSVLIVRPVASSG